MNCQNNVISKQFSQIGQRKLYANGDMSYILCNDNIMLRLQYHDMQYRPIHNNI